MLLGCLGGSVSWVSDFGLGHGLMICGFEPHVGLLHWQLGNCFRFAVSLSLSLSLSPAPPLLTLSLSKINKPFKKPTKTEIAVLKASKLLGTHPCPPVAFWDVIHGFKNYKWCFWDGSLILNWVVFLPGIRGSEIECQGFLLLKDS